MKLIILVKAIAFGVSHFTFGDLNTYFQLQFAVNFSPPQSSFKKISKYAKIGTFKNLVLHENDKLYILLVTLFSNQSICR